jgi:hypothetical protein
VIELRDAYDQQVRTAVANWVPAGRELTRDGPLIRVSGGFRGFVGYRELGGLTGPELAALIDRTIAYYDARGEAFEWKWHGHDEPADLAERLAARGFHAEEEETVLVGIAADLTESAVPAEIEIRELSEPAEFQAVARMESEVWGEDWSWLAEDLIARRAAEGELLRVFGAYGDGALVSAAWLVFNEGTEFAGLWGGSTLAGWRGRGVYRALVATRARLAVALGYRYLQVDASVDSSPILQRLGFLPVTRTRPYVHTPG